MATRHIGIFFSQKQLTLLHIFSNFAPKVAKMKRKTYQGLTFRPFIENEEIRQRVATLGKAISADYTDSYPLLVCVLNGAAPFALDLFRAIDIDAEITFIRLKSYEGTSSTGSVKQIMGLSEDISGRDVIIIEDIIDTGHTMTRLQADIKAMNPSSVRIATLLFKPEALQVPVTPHYVGFEIPKKFIIGYGLDIDGKARNLNDIYVLDE